MVAGGRVDFAGTNGVHADFGTGSKDGIETVGCREEVAAAAALIGDVIVG